ncbi:MAG: hypothetical protein Q4C52_08010 [Eubacteriales bacterium]|nr:hypothetical protein [Eubacteriales bacterium]
MKNTKRIILITVGILTFIYIRHQQMDIEIARFDYMMKVMKEEQRRSEE